jgi:hypothetical protein
MKVFVFKRNLQVFCRPREARTGCGFDDFQNRACPTSNQTERSHFCFRKSQL